jgi:methionyl-tRNA formyltransferase
MTPLALLGANARTAAVFEALRARGWPVEALVLDRPAPPLEARVRSCGVRVLAVPRPKSAEGLEALATLRLPRWVMAGYGKILPAEALALAPDGVLNLHAGSLPAYRGASVLNWQILRGEAAVGLAVLYTDAGVDTGPVLAEARLEVGPDEDYGSVARRANARFPALLLGALDALREGTARPTPQDPSAGRRWPKRGPEDGEVPWAVLGARAVHDFVRALARPCPGAFSLSRGGRVTLWKTGAVDEGGVRAPPGTVLAGSEGFRVAAATGALSVLEYEGPTPAVGEVLGAAPEAAAAAVAWLPLKQRP